ncbi:MAG TPA: hypothetical protein VMF06_01875 [Candidatus Limnocylindria bacterium]|nr:hypothetical protein [Candidatus Limnocylindria bacterium]
MNIPLMVLYRSAGGAALACAAQLSRLAQAYRIKLPVFDLLEVTHGDPSSNEQIMIVTAVDEDAPELDVHGFWTAASFEQSSNRNSIRFAQLFVGHATAKECREALKALVQKSATPAKRGTPGLGNGWLSAVLERPLAGARS